MEEVLIIEDDIHIQEIISICLEQEAIPFTIATTGEEGIKLAKQHCPSLILLDIMLPDMSGYTVCQEIKKVCKSPVIFVSCQSTENDQILGLSIGADDFIEKPFNINVLLAKVKAHLRRNRIINKNNGSNDASYLFDNIEVNPASREVKVNQKPVQLTAKEYELLLFLVKNKNQVFSTFELLEKVWGLDTLSENKTIVVHISSLRKKIEVDPLNPKYIITVRGAGYKFLYAN